MKTDFERGQLNAQDDLNANFKEIAENFAKLIDGQAITTINGGEGEVTNVSLNETKFGFGSTVRTTGTTPAFSVDADHYAVCQVAGTYVLSAQMNLQYNKEINGWNYVELEINNSRVGTIYAHGANTMRNKWYSSSDTLCTLKVGDKIKFVSTCSDATEGAAASLRCPFAKFQRIGD